MSTPSVAQIEIAAGHCQCGCGKRTQLVLRTDLSRGRRKNQPFRFLHGHNRRLGSSDYVVIESGCWEWQRGRFSTGYGRIRQNGKQLSAHRVFYEQARGSIPLGLFLDHLCRNRGCVNPAHLEPVSSAENNRRGLRTKLTPDQVKQIRTLVRLGTLHRQAAKEFNTSRSNIGLIVNWKNWR